METSAARNRPKPEGTVPSGRPIEGRHAALLELGIPGRDREAADVGRHRRAAEPAESKRFAPDDECPWSRPVSKNPSVPVPEEVHHRAGQSRAASEPR